MTATPAPRPGSISGPRLDYAIALDGGSRLMLSGRAAWAINSGTDRNFGAGFLALLCTSLTIDGAEPDRNALLVDAGTQYNAAAGFFAAAAFQGEFSGNMQSYSGKLKLGITWRGQRFVLRFSDADTSFAPSTSNDVAGLTRRNAATRASTIVTRSF